MTISNVQTSIPLVENDWDLSPPINTISLSVVGAAAQPLARTFGVLIPAVTTLLNITSPVLKVQLDGNGFEASAFTNPAIQYRSKSSPQPMETKKIITAEESLAFLDSIKLSFSADSFNREEANARC